MLRHYRRDGSAGCALSRVAKNPPKRPHFAEEPPLPLIGRAEGRPRPERVLKDAGALPSFRTAPAAEAGLQPVRSAAATTARFLFVPRSTWKTASDRTEPRNGRCRGAACCATTEETAPRGAPLAGWRKIPQSVPTSPKSHRFH